MNIKRAFLALSAMLLGVGFLGAFPQQAQAAIVCTNISAGTLYPDAAWTQKCVNGAATVPNATQANQMNAAASNSHGVATSELRRAANRNFTNLNGVRYYLFATQADYQAWTVQTGETYVAPAATDFGVTYFNTRNVPVYIAIFTQNQATPVETTNIARATGTQMGKALNYLVGHVKNGGIVPPVLFRVSDTIAPGTPEPWQNIFRQNLDKDWLAINVKAPCKVGSTFGLFSKYADNRLPVTSSTYICNDDPTTPSVFGDGIGLSPAYATIPGCPGATCNQAILNKAWPDLYPSIHTMFAQEIAFAWIGDDNATVGRTRDKYFISNFACSQWFAFFTANWGRLPTGVSTDQMPPGCVVPTMTTVCFKIFLGSGGGVGGHFPSGNMFNCSGSVVASQVTTKFNDLGANGAVPSYTKIKDLLDETVVDYYFFDNSTAHASAFADAQIPTGVLGSSIVGFTYPVGPVGQRIWYENFDAGFITSSALNAYIAAHETGHVVDLAIGQPSQSAAFDIAMQNDWKNLNWITHASQKRYACSTVAGQPGALVNIFDATNQPFCNGTVLNGHWNTDYPNFDSVSSTALLSQILQQNDGYIFHKTSTTPLGSLPGVTAAQGWIEFYAQAMAVRSRVDLASSSDRRYLDDLVTKGFFACTAGPNGWVQKNYTDPKAAVSLASLPAGCNAAPISPPVI